MTMGTSWGPGRWKGQDQDEGGGGASHQPAGLRPRVQAPARARRGLRPPRVQSWRCEAEGRNWLIFL